MTSSSLAEIVAQLKVQQAALLAFRSKRALYDPDGARKLDVALTHLETAILWLETV